MTPEPAKSSSEKKDQAKVDVGTADSLPVYLNDDALQSMEGDTIGTGAGTDGDEGARLATSGGESKRAVPNATPSGGARFSYLKALMVFLVVQLLILLGLVALFRKPLSQTYGKLVDRGFIEPGSLPWQRSAASTLERSPIGDVAWEDVRRRHELTLLADAAIARADRSAFDQLRGPLDSTVDPVLRAAVRAEIFRVQQMYASASRLPVEMLPVEQIHPGLSTESDLSEEQIVRILAGPDQTAEWRIRAAYLLMGHRTLSANDALVLAARNDPNLDVVKQAVQSFQANTGYVSGDLFDANGLEKWWANNASRLAGEFSNAVETPSVEDAVVPPTGSPATTSEVPGSAPNTETAPEGESPTPHNLRPMPADNSVAPARPALGAP